MLLSYETGAGWERAASDKPPLCSFHDITIEIAERVPYVIPDEPPKKYRVGEWLETPSRNDYTDMVRRAKEYIASGDIYQVNLARWFVADFEGDPFSYFVDLCRTNPSPHAAYVELEDSVVVSSSPELLFHARGDRIVTRPIAGTYPRDVPPERLTRDPKERAEHIMLVDLERNDLGRLAVPGTVVVEELLTTERYSHLRHIVSQVAARLRPGITLDDILRAAFPGGTITGAPKIRAMEIIAELEPYARGLYTGSIGLVTAEEMTFNIAIRTAVIRDGKIYLAAGAGIVADSDPGREADETRRKAAAFIELANSSPR